MDPELNQAIKQSIESGVYYKDAKKWYADRFLYPVVERSWALFITLLSVLGLIIIVINYYNSFPIVREVPIVVGSEDTTNYFSTIHPLLAKDGTSKDWGKTTNQSVAEYMIEAYVAEREAVANTLDPRVWQPKMDFIKFHSSPEVWREYQANLRADNPFVKVRKGWERKIKVDRLRMDAVQSLGGRARIYLTTTERYDHSEEANTQRWEVAIEYNMSDVNIAVSAGVGFEFEITSYQVAKFEK